ncbi:MAG: EpsI family protein [Rhodocyclaceae bacterium]|nr:EpsI family protein [Rhodocyclaceae bacterium]
MTTTFRTSLILMLAMIVASILPATIKPTKRLSQELVHIDLETAVPKSFGEWKLDPAISPIKPSAETQENLDKTYDQILSRTYVNAAGERIMLSMAYGGTQNRELRAHRQEVCYAAQGFKISKLARIDLPVAGTSIESTRMVAEAGGRVEPVTYWFTMGDQVVRSYLARQLVDLKYTLSGYIPDGYLFRVSSISNDTEGAFKKQHVFAEELLKHIDPALAARILGSPRERP